MNFQWRLNINLTRSMSVYSKENWKQKLFWEIFLAKTIFSIIKVGSYVRANSMVFFWPYKNKMYFGFWGGASTSLESVPQSRIFPNNRRPFNQWYKVQLIQSTHDGRSCRQELKNTNSELQEVRSSLLVTYYFLIFKLFILIISEREKYRKIKFYKFIS